MTHPNRTALETFAAQFSPPLKIVGTVKIAGQPVTNGFMCATHDKATGLGITAVCYGDNRFKAYLEAAGPATIAEASGRSMAEAMGRLR